MKHIGVQIKDKDNNNIYPNPFPIGAIYMSVDSRNPSKIFGGTWEQIKDKFLLCAGSTYSAGSTGGNASHVHSTGNCTLNSNQIPSHSHTGNTAGSGNHEHQVALNGDDGYNIWYRLNWGSTHTGYCITGNNANGQSSGATFPSIAKTNGWHAHSFTTDASGGGQAHNHGNTGSTSNMPPYLAVYVWRRTA